MNDFQVRSNAPVYSSSTVNKSDTKIIENKENTQNTDNSINTTDSASLKNVKKGSSPASVDILENEPDKITDSVNPLPALLALILVIGGGSGAYNPELFDAITMQLDKAQRMFERGGTETDMNIFGNIREKEKQQELEEKKKNLDKKD